MTERASDWDDDVPVVSSAGIAAAIIDAAPVGVCVTTEDGRFEHVNPAYLLLCGYREAELVGRRFTLVVPEEQREDLLDQHARLIAEGDDIRGARELVTRDGRRRTILANDRRVMGEDGRYRKVTFVVDVTEQVRMEAELARADQRLADLATHDSLTGLADHRRTHELLAKAAEAAGRYGRDLTVVMLDLDQFALVIDAFGHLVGDETLARFGRLLRSELRMVDDAGRVGGEVFLLILPETTPEAACTMLARLRQACWDTLRTPSGGPVWFSAGVVAFTGQDGLESLLQRAEETLRRAQAAGPDRVEIG